MNSLLLHRIPRPASTDVRIHGGLDGEIQWCTNGKFDAYWLLRFKDGTRLMIVCYRGGQEVENEAYVWRVEVKQELQEAA